MGQSNLNQSSEFMNICILAPISIILMTYIFLDGFAFCTPLLEDDVTTHSIRLKDFFTNNTKMIITNFTPTTYYCLLSTSTTKIQLIHITTSLTPTPTPTPTIALFFFIQVSPTTYSSYYYCQKVLFINNNNSIYLRRQQRLIRFGRVLFQERSSCVTYDDTIHPLVLLSLLAIRLPLHPDHPKWRQSDNKFLGRYMVFI